MLTKPLCPLFGACGGCQYQDIPYEEELSRKEGILKELLARELGLSPDVFEPITSSPQVYHYRNRLDLTLRKRNNGERQMGFMLPSTQRLQEVTACSIARPLSGHNWVLKTSWRLCAVDTHQTGIR